MTRSRLDVATALPQRDGRVTVRVQDGRGDVDVVQQPSARNDYTTIVRIRDRIEWRRQLPGHRLLDA